MTRRSAFTRWLFVALISSAAMIVAPSSVNGDFVIAPGFLYAPSSLSARQFSPSLQLVGTGGPVNLLGATGAAISRDGLFLYEAYRQNVAGLPDGAHLLALGNGGTIVHELHLTNFALSGPSGIGVDSSGRIYAAAFDGLHEISANFSTNTVLPIAFQRATGVAVAPNDFLYMTDSDAEHIKIIDNHRQLVGTIPTGRVPTGVTMSPDGFLYYTDTPFQSADYLGRLVKVDLVSHQQTVVHGNLEFPRDVEFAPDGSYYVAVRRKIEHYSASNLLIHSFSDGESTDQLVFLAPVPEPSSLMLVGISGLGMLGLGWWRRRTERKSPETPVGIEPI